MTDIITAAFAYAPIQAGIAIAGVVLLALGIVHLIRS